MDVSGGNSSDGTGGDGGDGDGTRGILSPGAMPDVFRVDRLEPSADLDDLVAVHWRVAWDLPAGREHESLVLSYPAVNVSFEPDGAWVTGPVSGTYRRRLTGRVAVPAVRFRPAAFRSLVDRSVSSLRDRVVPAGELLPLPPAVVDGIRAAPDLAAARPLVEQWLRGLPRRRTDEQAKLDAAVELVERDRSLTRVDQLAERCGRSVRWLQRAFADAVGLPVKQVIRMARLREVAQRALTGDVDWAAVATDLGYTDQAHLVRDFTAAVGTPPARYARSAR
ncbi:helix-turn-helix domain-containing protein [Trujillonella endophytica]|uniref:Helix-turn-helix domain-containing protein n=1 Tax=Trujillonella endophytica TaxID=673521 RepID=A0A1H8T5D0_9ACTN|nr:helix-turn-helix transcriptional regulator [Trujillella endophytica]SEO85906.1 Helix-turn-helix domain-containing protein [Trujillella endophytica]